MGFSVCLKMRMSSTGGLFGVSFAKVIVPLLTQDSNKSSFSSAVFSTVFRVGVNIIKTTPVVDLSPTI